MKIIMWVVLLLMEYVLFKIVWLLVTSLVLSGLAPAVGVIVAAFFVLVMGVLWRYGAKQIRG